MTENKTLKELREELDMDREDLALAVNARIIETTLAELVGDFGSPEGSAVQDAAHQMYDGLPEHVLSGVRDAARQAITKSTGAEHPPAETVEDAVVGTLLERARTIFAEMVVGVEFLVEQLAENDDRARGISLALQALVRAEGVDAETIGRWEEIGIDYVGTRGADNLFNEGATSALLEVLKPHGGVLSPARPAVAPGDLVVKDPHAKDTEEKERFTALPDGTGGTYLKPGEEVTGDDIETLANWHQEEHEHSVAMLDHAQGQLNNLTSLGAKDGVEAEETIRKEVEKLDDEDEDGE